MKQKVITFILLLFPLLILAGMATQASLNQRGDDRWQIKIGGYDPRHPLMGHYLTYQYVWNHADEVNNKTCPDDGGMCCACLTEGDSGRTNPKVSFHSCISPALESCTSVIKGRNEWGSFEFGENQFFIPEQHATLLDRLLREGKHEFHMEINIPKSKRAVLLGLTINEKPWQQFLAEQPAGE